MEANRENEAPAVSLVTAGPRCLVLYRESLLAQAVGNLLQTDQDIQVSLADMSRVEPMAAILAADPEILIMDLDNIQDLSSFLGDLLRTDKTPLIMFLNPRDNVVYTWRTRKLGVESACDFLAALRDEVMTSPQGGAE